MEEGEAGSGGWGCRGWGSRKAFGEEEACIWASRGGELTQQWGEGEDIPSREAALAAWGPGGLWGIS